eukprot:m.36803 g.36803  ORF g.36803 m.36803 type:complete len:704 (-) comp6697_c0_seq2:1588-3699(-)
MSKAARKEGLASLAELQNLIKRDSEAYSDEFHQQLLHYKSTLDIFKLRPSGSSEELGQLVQFLAAVSHCFPKDLESFPNDLVGLLEEHSDALDPDLRQALCRSLIMLRNKGFVKSSSLLELFFKLFRVPDKLLRETLYRHIINDIRQINKKQKNNTVNKTLQNFMFVMLKDSSVMAAKKSLDVMVELYTKSVWTDDKTVNVIATALLSDKTKLMATALRFFLKSNDDLEEEAMSGDEDENVEAGYKSMLLANEHNKKTAKRQRKRDKALRMMKKQERKTKKAPSFNFAALHLINDPQSLAEKMYVKLKKSKTVKFEVRLMMMNFISRLIGIHELFVLEFYSFLQRFLDQRQNITQILMYIAQASHPLVPADCLAPVLRTIANNFISERSPPEHIAVGINSIREICARCPLAIPQELLADLAQYVKHKNASVVMAARSLIQSFRDINPLLLEKKHRGRPGHSFDADQQELVYGKERVYDVIPGLELLTENMEKDEDEENDESDDEDVEDDDDDGEEEDVAEDVATKVEEETKKVVTAERVSRRRLKKLQQQQKHQEEAERREEEAIERKRHITSARSLGTTRILTQEDFDKIRELEAQKLMDPLMGKRTSEMNEIMDELDIIPEMKKKKMNKEERLEMVFAGRDGRGKFGAKKGKMNEMASQSNKIKIKRKNPMMLKHSFKFRSKKNMSMNERQRASHKKKKKF